MKHPIALFFFLSILGCSSEHVNKEKYVVQVGETVEIFYGENSCCERCWNDMELDHLEFVTSATIEFDPDCAGCTNTFSRTYKAVSAGADTLKTHSFAMSDSCNLASEYTEIFLVSVKDDL